MKNSFKENILLSILLSVPLHAAADPPRVPQMNDADRTGLSNLPNSGLQIGTQKIELEKTQISSLVLNLGAGKIFSNGDAGNAESWVCYRLPEGFKLWIVSTELGGREKFAARWHLEPARDNNSKDCFPISKATHFYDKKLEAWWMNRKHESFEMTEQGVPKRKNGWHLYFSEEKSGASGWTTLSYFGVKVSEEKI